MRKFAIAAGLMLVLGACSSDPTGQIEDSIRETLSNETTIDEVQMNMGADGNMSGYALTHEADGRKGRLKCAAQPDGGSTFKWQCSPQIDAETERQMQEKMRAEFAKQGEVIEVVMKRKDDDNHMAGSARLKTADGVEHSLSCTATRQEKDHFKWECEETGGSGDAAEGGDADAESEADPS